MAWCDTRCETAIHSNMVGTFSGSYLLCSGKQDKQNNMLAKSNESLGPGGPIQRRGAAQMAKIGIGEILLVMPARESK